MTQNERSTKRADGVKDWNKREGGRKRVKEKEQLVHKDREAN